MMYSLHIHRLLLLKNLKRDLFIQEIFQLTYDNIYLSFLPIDL